MHMALLTELEIPLSSVVVVVVTIGNGFKLQTATKGREEPLFL
jgi:hypothetical protein